MPTASPSITPRTGVTDAIWIDAREGERPGHTDGDPDERRDDRHRAARMLPSMTRSTTAAKTTPASSPTPKSAGTPCEISVENPTSTPSIFFDSKWSTTACFELSDSSRRGWVNATFTLAVEPSVETKRMSDASASSWAPRRVCGPARRAPCGRRRASPGMLRAGPSGRRVAAAARRAARSVRRRPSAWARPWSSWVCAAASC